MRSSGLRWAVARGPQQWLGYGYFGEIQNVAAAAHPARQLRAWIEQCHEYCHQTDIETNIETGAGERSAAEPSHSQSSYWSITASQDQLSSAAHTAHASKATASIINASTSKSIAIQSIKSIAKPIAKPIAIATLSASGLPPETPFSRSDDLGDAWVVWRMTGSGPQLTLGRDRFGRVPLYWLRQEQTLWFATRLQLLLPLVAGIQINEAALYGYSCLSYVPTPLTPVQGIEAIAAGESLTWSHPESFQRSQCRVIRDQWREQPQQIDRETEAVSELQTHLRTAVARQTQDLSGESVGVFLSGGLDSSVVAALLSQAGVNVRAYALDLGQHACSELPYAKQVAHHLQIPLTVVAATPLEIQSAWNQTAEALDLPFGDSVTVPLYLLNQAASQEVSIVFNGEGGDQLFAGWTNKPLIAAGLYQAEHPHQNEQSFEQQYLRTFHRLWGRESQVFQPSLYQTVKSLSPQDWLGSALLEGVGGVEGGALLHRLRRASLMLKGAQNIHSRATNLAFAHGLWVRSPFCDPDLADWTFRVAPSLFLQGSCEKYILKRAVQDWLPPEIVWRSKRGMGVPVTAWCLNEFWQDLGHLLNPGTLRAEGHWQPELPQRLAFGQVPGISGRRIGEAAWLIMMWQLWRSQVLKEPARHQSWKHPFWVPYSIWKSAWRLRKRWLEQ